MLDQLAGLLTGRARGRTLDLAAAPPDVLMQSAIVLRSLDAAVTRLDLDTGALEARLAPGGLLRLRAEPAGSPARRRPRGPGGAGRVLSPAPARGVAGRPPRRRRPRLPVEHGGNLSLQPDDVHDAPRARAARARHPGGLHPPAAVGGDGGGLRPRSAEHGPAADDPRDRDRAARHCRWGPRDGPQTPQRSSRPGKPVTRLDASLAAPASGR